MNPTPSTHSTDVMQAFSLSEVANGPLSHSPNNTVQAVRKSLLYRSASVRRILPVERRIGTLPNRSKRIRQRVQEKLHPSSARRPDAGDFVMASPRHERTFDNRSTDMGRGKKRLPPAYGADCRLRAGVTSVRLDTTFEAGTPMTSVTKCHPDGAGIIATRH